MKWHRSQKDTLYAITQYACLTKYLYPNNVQEHSYILSMHRHVYLYFCCIYLAGFIPRLATSQDAGQLLSGSFQYYVGCIKSRII